MKRDNNLQPLSRQHHNGLLMALLLSKGIKKNANLKTMADFILDSWKKELNQHFILEEEILLPALKEKTFDPTLTARLLSEHQQIRSLVRRMEKGEFTVEDISDFSRLLEQHIRFEERIYFPEAEKQLTPDELKHIGGLLQDTEDSNCINYPIKFWDGRS